MTRFILFPETGPGAMAFTRILYEPTSAASVRQRDQPRFGDRVGRPQGIRALAGHRTYVNDLSAPSFYHSRQNGPATQKWPGQIDSDLFRPRLRVQLGHGSGGAQD